MNWLPYLDCVLVVAREKKLYCLLRARGVEVKVFKGDVAEPDAVHSCNRSFGKNLGGSFSR